MRDCIDAGRAAKLFDRLVKLMETGSVWQAVAEAMRRPDGTLYRPQSLCAAVGRLQFRPALRSETERLRE